MKQISKVSPWFSFLESKSNALLRLFCFPYAGGSSVIYRNWQNEFPASVNVFPVQLPGHGERMREKPFSQITPLIFALTEALMPFLDRPFAFFGHSMGALISYELAHFLRSEKQIHPQHLFVSGHTAPHLKNRGVISYNLPEPDFVEELKKLNGTPKEVLEHPELMSLMIPLLRADFEICETYRYQANPPLECPITAFAGASDVEVSDVSVTSWKLHTRSQFNFHVLPGDHFFVNTAQTEIARMIVNDLGDLI